MAKVQEIQVTPEQFERLMKMQSQQQLQGTPERVLQEGEKPPSAMQIMGPDGRPQHFQVNARDCVEEDYLDKNIAVNLKLIDEWVELCSQSKGRVFICSGGPSTEKYIELVKQEKEAGSLIVCVKHSLPMLLKEGIVPDACVILDPRDIEGTSTQNVKRTELFKRIPKETTFFIASMTNPTVTKYLQGRGAKLKGWHPEVNGIKDKFKVNVPWSIVGGSCSAIRAITLFKALGFSDFGLLGFDCCFYDIPDDIGAKLKDDPNGRPKYLQVQMFGETFLTTGEMVALGQDMERLFSHKVLDFNIEMYGDGMGPLIHKNVYRNKPTYEEMLDNKKESWQVND